MKSGQDTLSAQKNFSDSNQDDEFDDYVEPVPSQLQNTKSSQEPAQMSFDDLFKNPKIESHQSVNNGSQNNFQPSTNQFQSNNMQYGHIQGQNFNNFNVHNNHHMNYIQPSNNMQRGFSNNPQQGYNLMQNGGYNNFTHNP